MKKVVLATAFLFASSMFVTAQSSPSSTDQSASPSSQSASPSASPSSQSPSSTDQQPSSMGSQSSSQMGSSNEQKIEGCLSQGANGFTLADASGTTYNLTGDTSKLSSHVGEQVEVKGAPSSGSAAASSNASATGQASSSPTAGGASAGQNFDVKSVKRVAKSCSTSGSSTASPK